jgi:hypothetical protein
MSKIKDAIDKIAEAIDLASENLSLKQYAEVMDEIACDCQDRAEVAREEMRSDQSS